MGRGTRGRPASGPRPAAATVLARAAELQRRGDLKGAESLCREVLTTAPRNPQALHLLGITLQQGGRRAEALESLQRAARLAPRDVSLLNNLGNVLLEHGRLAEAVATYRRVIAQQPSYHHARFNLGRALQAMGDARQAVACYGKLLEVAPDDAGVWEALCGALLDSGQAVEAVEAGRRAVELAPGGADAHNGLGLAFADLGRFDEAAACYRRALDLLPGFSKAALNLSKVKRYGDADAADIERIEAVDEVAGLGPAERADIGFARGKIAEDMGRYDAAFDAYRRANELRAAEAHYDPDAHSEWVTGLMRVFSRPLFESLGGLGRDDPRPVFIVGLPRSGTSLVEQILASHSRVHGAGELAVMQNLINALPGRCAGRPYPGCMTRIQRTVLRWLADGYLEELVARGGDRPRVTDKMPGNFLHLGLIALALPHASIVHCVRDPMDIGLSLYCHQFAGGHPYSWRLEHIGAYIRDYRRLMAHWRDVLPVRLHEVRYEELVDEPERVARGMVAHCGLEWEPACLDFHRSERAVHTASAWQVRQPIYRGSSGRWRRYEAHLGPLAAALEVAPDGAGE